MTVAAMQRRDKILHFQGSPTPWGHEARPSEVRASRGRQHRTGRPVETSKDAERRRAGARTIIV